MVSLKERSAAPPPGAANHLVYLCFALRRPQTAQEPVMIKTLKPPQMCGQISSKVKRWHPGDSGPAWKTVSRPRRGLSRQPPSSSSIPVVLPTLLCPLMQEAGRWWPLCELALQGEVYGEGRGRLSPLGITPPSYFSRGVNYSRTVPFLFRPVLKQESERKKKKVPWHPDAMG